MGIETGDGDARFVDSTTTNKIVEQQTDARNLFGFQSGDYLAKRKVNSHESDGESSAGQQHREVFRPATLGKKFGLAREFESDLVHPRFVDRRGNDRIDLAAQRELRSFFERGERSLSGFRRWLA